MAIQSLKENPLKALAYLRLTPVGLDEDEKYDYSRPELWEYIQYLPEELSKKQFYIPWMTSQYEKALAENYRRIIKHGRTHDIKALNQYYGDLSLENEDFGSIQEYLLKNNSINNSNVRQVGFMF